MQDRAVAEDGWDPVRERRGGGDAGRQQQNHQVRPQSGAQQFPKHSYWLDLWLFILFDLALFFFVYFLPCSNSQDPLAQSTLAATDSVKKVLAENEKEGETAEAEREPGTQ